MEIAELGEFGLISHLTKDIELKNAETLKGAAPMKCYVDSWKSYSTNEIAIYWNSPLVFVLALLA